MNQPNAVREMLQAVAAGHLSPETAFEKLQQSASQSANQSASPADGQTASQSASQSVNQTDNFRQTQGYETVGDFAKIDHARTERTGFPEVIWGQDKTAAQIVEIMKVMEPRHPVVMATRVSAEKSAEIQAALPQATYFEMARICAIQPSAPLQVRPGKLSILTAGTADLPVAEEAAVTAELCGFR